MKLPFLLREATKQQAPPTATTEVQPLKAYTKNIKRKVQARFNRENFDYPNTSFYEIRRAMGTDSYISESFRKHQDKIFKAGYQLKGEEEVANYIKNRFSMMSFQTKTPIDILFQEIADDFLVYSNAFLLKIRTEHIPFISAKGFYHENPVGGYIRLDPCMISIVSDKYGNIIRYEIEHDSGVIEKVLPYDIIHFYCNRPSHSKFGMPRIAPALEDVKALRSIEDDILTLIRRFCFPFFHVKVGIDKPGYTGTPTEIDVTKQEIEEMDEDSMLVTNEKVSIQTIGAEGNALNMEPYLNHFEKRVFSVLNVSDTLMGRNADSSPDSLDESIHDAVKAAQRFLSIFIESEIINELLLEGGFNPILNNFEKISFLFNEISLDTKVKLENHEMLKYERNVQSLHETRQGIGKTDELDTKDLHIENVTIHSAIEQIEAKNDSAIELIKEQSKLAEKANKQAQISTKSNQGNGTVVTHETKDVENRNRPQNQHGIYSVKIKESLKNIEKQKNIFSECCKIYDLACNDFIRNKDKATLKKACLKMCDLLPDYLEGKADFALQEVNKTYKHLSKNAVVELESEKMIEEMAHAFAKLFEDLSKRLDKEPAKDAFDKSAYRINIILSHWGQKYYWYVYATACKSLGIKKLQYQLSPTENKGPKNKYLKLDDITYDKLPPFHPFCKCKIGSKDRKEH